MTMGCLKVQQVLRQHCSSLVPFLGAQLQPNVPEGTQLNAVSVLRSVLPHDGPPLDAKHFCEIIIAAADSLLYAAGEPRLPSVATSGDFGEGIVQVSASVLDVLSLAVVSLPQHEQVRHIRPALRDRAWPAMRALLLTWSPTH